jgi:hypothetical protein
VFRISSVWKPGVQDRCGLRDFISGLVMIDYDQVDTKLTRTGSSDAIGSAAIHRYENFGPLLVSSVNASRLETIAVVNAVRHKIIDVGTNGTQCQKQHNSACDSINVIVTMHNDPFTTFDGSQQPFYGRLHLDERKR